MIDWHTRTFAEPEELRQIAAKESRLAEAARLDGDERHAVYHEQLASEYREAARLKEIE